MSFDLFAVVIAFVLAGLGYHAGALKQLNRLAGLVLAFFAAPTVAAVFKELWFQEVEPGQPLVEWALLGLAGVAVYALVAVVGFLVIRLLRLSSDELTRKDRVWGGLMGALKGALVVWLAAQSVLLIEEPLQKADPKDVLRLQRSALVEIVRDHPVALGWALPELTQLQTLLEGARQRPAQELRDDAAAQRLLSWEGVPELLADPEVRQAVEERAYSRLLARSDVRDLLADPAFRETLQELAW
jgi:uncharacterized membrane protein required for colicin V production